MSPAVDVLIRNARVYTVDEARPWAGAVAVRGERIIWVGDDADAQEEVGSAREVIDAAGRLVLPGIVDSHNHVRLGSNEHAVQLAGSTSLEDVRGRISAWLEHHTDSEWVEGEAFNYGALGEARMPTADDLEGATGGRPAFIFTFDVHKRVDEPGGARAVRSHTGYGATLVRHRPERPRDRGADGDDRGLRRDGHRARGAGGASAHSPRVLARTAVRATPPQPRHGHRVRHHDDRRASELARRSAPLSASTRRGTAALEADRRAVPSAGNPGRGPGRFRRRGTKLRRRPVSSRTAEALHRRRHRTAHGRTLRALRDRAAHHRRDVLRGRRVPGAHHEARCPTVPNLHPLDRGPRHSVCLGRA